MWTFLSVLNCLEFNGILWNARVIDISDFMKGKAGVSDKSYWQ